MKKMFLFVLFVLLFGPSVAQDSAKLARRAELLAMPRSHIALGVGVPPSIFGQTSMPRPERVLSPMVGISYAYRVWQFLEVGGSLGYSYAAKREQADGATWDENHLFCVAVFARYAWFNRRWVSLYSSLGIFTSLERYSQSGTWRSGVTGGKFLAVLPDVSPIGVRVGRRLFGYVEPFCFNGRGFFVQAGLGYKF